MNLGRLWFTAVFAAAVVVSGFVEDGSTKWVVQLLAVLGLSAVAYIVGFDRGRQYYEDTKSLECSVADTTVGTVVEDQHA